jgi:very-short-patch-repair endonuclease
VRYLDYILRLTDTQETPALVVVMVIAVLMASAALLRPQTGRLRPKPILTPNELEFFNRLRHAVPHLLVFPQMAMSAIVTDDGRLRSRARWKLRARFDRKICDYVVCDRQQLRVIAIVELDDILHNPIADRARDAVTTAAGYRTFRFSSRNKPPVQELAEVFVNLFPHKQ